MGGRIAVLLADGHSLFREAIKAVIEAHTDLVVVAEARDGLEAVAEAERTRPDVALVDAHLRNPSGIRATALIKERVPRCRVLVIGEEDDHHALVGAVEAGASGYLTSEHPLAELIDGVRSVHEGETLIPQRMLGVLLALLLGRRRETDDARLRLGRLTSREKEVLALLARGADNDAIASTLVISPQTARTHVQRMMAKLGVHSRLEAVAFVTQKGVLQELGPTKALAG